jgi:hypothetical protein
MTGVKRGNTSERANIFSAFGSYGETHYPQISPMNASNLNPKIIIAALAVSVIGLLVALYVEVSPFTEIGAGAVIGGLVVLVMHLVRSRN